MNAAMEVAEARRPARPGVEPGAPVLQLNQVEKVYRTDRIETVALMDVSLDVREGEFISIMGPSGCGKSTLLNIMGLLDTPTRGSVSVAGTPLTSADDRTLAKTRNKDIGFVFQTFHLIPDLSVLDNVVVPLLYRRMGHAERRRRALEALDAVGLSSRVHHYPSQLSGGQQQRVAIARAIVGRPRVLLADEPTGNLDSQMGDEIVDLLTDLQRTDGLTIVMVTHDPRQAEKTQKIVRLFDGRRIS